MGSWVFWALLFIIQLQENHSNDTMLRLPVPQAVKLVTDLESQRLFVTWERAPINHSLMAELSFDIEVLQNERAVHKETIKADPDLKSQQWNWTSAIPLQCTSHSVRVRNRMHNLTSQWSPKKTVNGMDVPSHKSIQVYPGERVFRVGSTVYFCCIVSEGHELKSFTYNDASMASTPISDRTHTIRLRNLSETKPSGNEVACFDSSQSYPQAVTIFVGSPPGDQDLVCETDLVNLVCRWDLGQPTHLSGNRRTQYILNGRDCPEANKMQGQSLLCSFDVPLDQGEQNFTLTAKNQLGSIVLTSRVDLSHRVRMQAPLRVTTPEVNAWNTTVQWNWEVDAYRTLPLWCQVQLNYKGYTDTHNYSGPGLSRLVLTSLQPDSKYSLQVRCGTQQHFYEWSSWSSKHSFRTKMDCPDALDVWIQMKSNHSALLMWKPLSASESHGKINGYNVTWDSSMGKQESKKIHYSNHSFLLRDLGNGVATVTAFNDAGSSPPSKIKFPIISDSADNVLRISGTDGGFNMSWPATPSTTCGYIVEWCRTHSRSACKLDWVKVPAQYTETRIPAKHFMAGVKYSLSIYSCSHGRPALLTRQEGYTVEKTPNQQVQNLKVDESGSEVRLHWEGVPLEGQRGFIRGYYIYQDLSSGKKLEGNITDPDAREHTVRNLPPGPCKLTVKPYNSVGEGVGCTITINLKPSSDLLYMTFICLGSMAFFLIIGTVVCYWKRKWMKEALHPFIPQPKIQQDWSTSPMFVPQMPDLDQCHYDRVEVISDLAENSGEAPGEEKEGSVCSLDTDSSSALLCTYNTHILDRMSSRLVPQGTRDTGAFTVIGTPLAPAWQGPGSEKYQPQSIAAAPGGAPADLPLLVDDGYQPIPAQRPTSPGTGSLNESLETPTSADSFTFLLGRSPIRRTEQSPALANPAWVHKPNQHRNYTNPTYQSTDPTHLYHDPQ